MVNQFILDTPEALYWGRYRMRSIPHTQDEALRKALIEPLRKRKRPEALIYQCSLAFIETL
jgi:hypothetical protein